MASRSSQVFVLVLVVLFFPGLDAASAGGSRRLLQAPGLQAPGGSFFPVFPGLTAPSIPIVFPPIFASPGTPSSSSFPNFPLFPGYPLFPGPGNPSAPNAPQLPGNPTVPNAPRFVGNPSVPNAPRFPGNPTLPNAPAAPAFTPPLAGTAP